ncbi:MAG TPA: ACP S-malonyltransferase [Longimicrobiaceae bacterium]|nr:ACP S-malonyltransferase [Longimicrobiaceae bacterium]
MGGERGPTVSAAEPVSLLFPGQGSQFVGMGRDLAESFPEAAKTFREADEILGTALSRLCWEGPLDELTLTINAQPAILIHSIAVWRVFGPHITDISMAAGHSLGEFTAYVAAGVLDFGDALRVVRRRGELMYESGSARPGTMAAVIGLDDQVLERVCADASRDDEVVVLANLNAPGQVVISGDLAAVSRAGELAREAGAKRVLPLSVSGAFHSPLMKVAEPGLREELAGVVMHGAHFPVVSNVTAEPVQDPDTARRLLVEQLTSPVRWVESVRAMAAAGGGNFLELGPGSVLTGLLKRIDKGATSRPLGTADEIDAFKQEEG